MTYEERQNLKIERYTELAEKNRNKSTEAYNISNDLFKGIPAGQPILVGHHSENAHRRLIKRSHALMDKGIESQNKAEYYDNKVKNIKEAKIISSDDENAIIKLEDKLKRLESQREEIKEENKKARKERKEQNPAYILSNLGQNIKSVKVRIERLKSIQEMPEEEIKINDTNIKIDKEANRVKIFFPGKPEEDLRTNLKRNGFRWSPYNSCWQRQISDYALHLAKDFANQYKEGQ